MNGPLCRSATGLFMAALAAGCGTEAKKEAAKTAVDAMTDEQRKELFEATSRLLDEDPRRVDELYAVVRRHEPTMRRFLENASRDLHEPQLAAMTAELVAQHPASVEQALVSATDAISKSPDARRAMRRGIARRAAKAVDVLTDDAATLARLLDASLTVIETKPSARENLLEVARQERRRVIAFVKSDPDSPRR